MEKIAPDLGSSERPGFRDDLDAVPAPAAQPRIGQAGLDLTLHFERCRFKRRAKTAQGFAARHDEGTRPRHLTRQPREFAADPLGSFVPAQARREVKARHGNARFPEKMFEIARAVRPTIRKPEVTRA